MAIVTHNDQEAAASAGIRMVAARLLQTGLDDLVEASTAQILIEEPTYAAVAVRSADVERQTRRTLALTLYRVSGIAIPEGLGSAAFETGQRRAEQGLPLSSLLHSFRIDLRLLWEAIIQEGRRHPSLKRLEILEQHALLWQALEANTNDVVNAYHLVEQRRTRSRDRSAREAFKRFVERGDDSKGAVVTFAGHASLPLQGTYVAFALSCADDAHEVLTALEAHLRVQGRRFYATALNGQVCGVVLADLDAVQGSMISDLRAGSVAVLEVKGLAEAPTSLRAVRRAADTLPANAIVNVAHQILAVLAQLEPDIIGAVIGTRMGGMANATAAEARAIWEMIDALTRSDGTYAGLAAATFRHRNTIRARAERLHELTELDIRVPADQVVLAFASASRTGSNERGGSD